MNGKHTAKAVARRLSTGAVLPLTHTEPLVAFEPRRPRWETSRPMLWVTVEPARPMVKMDDSNPLHAHGWPTWEDAWGEPGKRPGGFIRATLRGVVRLPIYVGLPVMALSALGGGDGFAAGLIVFLMLAVPAIAFAVPVLYILRANDFDRAKGLAAGIAYTVLLTVWNHTHPRKPYAGPAGNPRYGQSRVPPWSGSGSYNMGVKPPWM